MKIFNQICLVSLSILTLSGCTIKKPPQDLQIQASGGFDENHISMKIESTLPKNAKLEFLIKDDVSKKTIYQSIFITDNKGSFNRQFNAPLKNKKVTGYLFFKPEDQPKEIEDKYGEKGQNIRTNTIGLTKINNNSYVKLYGTFWKYKLQKNGQLVFAPVKIEMEENRR